MTNSPSMDSQLPNLYKAIDQNSQFNTIENDTKSYISKSNLQRQKVSMPILSLPRSISVTPANMRLNINLDENDEYGQISK